jgi:hypothetical protein
VTHDDDLDNGRIFMTGMDDAAEQGSILQSSISAENVFDVFLSSI